jgi:MFS family permease
MGGWAPLAAFLRRQRRWSNQLTPSPCTRPSLTLCNKQVTSFWQFIVLRMLTGIAVGGVFPLVFSLLGDLFPATQRSAMASLVQIAMGLGIGGGQMVAGTLGPMTNWRLPFVIVAAPAVLLALVMVLTTREPPRCGISHGFGCGAGSPIVEAAGRCAAATPLASLIPPQHNYALYSIERRGAFEEALKHQYAEGIAYEETISWAKARQALRAPSNWVLILQAVPGCLPWGVIQTYMNDYLSQVGGGGGVYGGY